MSLRARLLAQRIPRSTLSTSHLSSYNVACFTHCAKRSEENTAKSRPETDESRQSENDRRYGPQPNSKGGWRLPALLLFAAGLPVGWYWKSQYGHGHRQQVSGPEEFVKYTLSAKDNVSSTCAIFKLKPSSNVTIDQDDPSLERAITSIEFKQPQLQIARSYTCLPQERGQHMNELRFLIRREQKGEVSNFLHRLGIESEIEVRGLTPEYILPDDVKSAVFLAGGTGIAPAMQAVDIIDGKANMHILWANRRREDCIGGYSDTAVLKGGCGWWSRSGPATADTDRTTAQAEKGALVALLEGLKTRSTPSSDQPPRLLVDYYVDEEGTHIRPEEVKNVLRNLSRNNGHDVQGRRILFVSGPEGFMNYWAGSKQWANGLEIQGPLRGVLSTMDLAGWEIVKL